MDIQVWTLSTLVLLGSSAAPYAHATRVNTNPNHEGSSAHATLPTHTWENRDFGSGNSVYDIQRGRHEIASASIQFEAARDSRYEKKTDHRAEESEHQWSRGGKWHDHKVLPLNLHQISIHGNLGGNHHHGTPDCTPTPVPLGNSLSLFASALAALGLRYRKRLTRHPQAT